MNWYLAKLTFRITSGYGQFDEQLRMIYALDEEEALLKARKIGLQQEECLMTSYQQPVAWEFVNVAELIALPSLADGMEVYSRLFETNEPERHVHDVHRRAMDLQLHFQARA
jgi:hypothetical protein